MSSRAIASDIAALRASSSIFLKKDFRHIKWAGVFGSFARETQTDSSDVDVVVIRPPLEKTCRMPPETLLLEDALPQVWGRKVDVISIEEDELRGYVSLEALLCSRTLFGSDQDDEVVRLRGIARDTLDSGFTKFVEIMDKIRRTQSRVSDLDFEVCNLFTTAFNVLVLPIMLTTFYTSISTFWHRRSSSKTFKITYYLF